MQDINCVARGRVSTNQRNLESVGYKWLKKDEGREKLLLSFIQPMTARRLSTRTGLSLEKCSYILKRLAALGISECLNPSERKGRLFGLTPDGITLREEMAIERGIKVDYFPDWEKFGKLDYPHRRAVLLAWNEPDECLQAITITKRAKKRNPKLRMSSNNSRDTLKDYRSSNLADKHKSGNGKFPIYKLREDAWLYKLMLERQERI